jgi:oligoribonuclease
VSEELNDELMVWVDTESFGLDKDNDPLIEVGITVTNLDLEVLDHDEWLIWGPLHERAYARLAKEAEKGGDDFVYKMHTENGLFRQAGHIGMNMHEVEASIVEWMSDTEVGDVTNIPMSGSSVHFDRKFFESQMPLVNKAFHYRIIDNSTVKELCRRYNPSVFAQAPEAKHVAPMHHRVELCLEDTINEFKYYRDNFIFDARADVLYAEG